MKLLHLGLGGTLLKQRELRETYMLYIFPSASLIFPRLSLLHVDPSLILSCTVTCVPYLRQFQGS